MWKHLSLFLYKLKRWSRYVVPSKGTHDKYRFLGSVLPPVLSHAVRVWGIGTCTLTSSLGDGSVLQGPGPTCGDCGPGVYQGSDLQW